MTRMTTITCLFFLITACTPMLEKRESNQHAEQLHNALIQLFDKTNSEPLSLYIKMYPESIFAKDAKNLLNLHNNNKHYMKKLKACQQQNLAAKVEIEKLQADIERLTQLHLKMGRNDL
jgi:hypothetical protein